MLSSQCRIVGCSGVADLVDICGFFFHVGYIESSVVICSKRSLLLIASIIHPQSNFWMKVYVPWKAFTTELETSVISEKRSL